MNGNCVPRVARKTVIKTIPEEPQEEEKVESKAAFLDEVDFAAFN